MKPETFFENFDLLENAPNSVPKLRELILQLAVQGKLVPQDPNDEPASVLVEKITAEKEQLVKEGKIKKQKLMPPIGEDEKPFELPLTWEWSRIGNISHDWGQKLPDRRFTYIDVGAINKELGFVAEPNVLDAGNAPSRARKIIKKGTVIYSTVRPYLLNIAVIDKDFDPEPIASTAFAIVHPFEGISASFIYRYLRSPSFIQYVEKCQTGIAYPAVNDKQFFSGLLPIPPSAEQHRIVAKVDQLMGLCDELEEKQKESGQIHLQLNNSCLNRLLYSQTPEEFQEHWTRITENFDLLYNHPETIAKLRQAILQLAVQGKLVPQDPNDEPVAVLLEKIAEEKARLVEEGKIKKQKPLPEITEDEKPFRLPEGWHWMRLGDASVLKGGFAYQSSAFSDLGDHQVIRMGNIRPNYLRLDQKPAYIPANLGKKTKDYLIELNNILITMTGTKGKRDYLYSLIVQAEHLIERKLYLNQRLCIVRGLFIVPEFLNITIKDDRLLNVIYAQSTGTANQANIGMVALSKWVLPLPPIEEQKRIVAKVDQLMALCDELEEKLKQSQGDAEKLMSSTVHHLLAS